MGRFGNDIQLTLAAYNAGEQAVARHGNAILPYKETQNYVPRVMSDYSRNQQQPWQPFRSTIVPENTDMDSNTPRDCHGYILNIFLNLLSV